MIVTDGRGGRETQTMTYTVLVRDREHGLFGAGGASCSLAMGNSVLALEPRVGIVASQAWTNRVLRHHMLTALRSGAGATEAVARVPEWDAQPELRQVAALAMDGLPAARTGRDNTPWAGDHIGEDFALVGNFLVGAGVLHAAAESLEAPAPANGPPARLLADRIVRALRAGEAAGGDLRGRQSAVVLVAEHTSDDWCPPEHIYDLRVDDDDDPLGKLARLVSLRSDHLAEKPAANQS